MSELTQQRVRVEGRWQPRFALAALLRVIAYGLPVLSGSAVAWLVSRELTGAEHRLLATVTVLGAAVVVSLLVSRLTMRLMPLAMLLRMTMIFPDRAPSRVKVARVAGSTMDIGERLRSRSADESEAAMTMLSLVTALGRHDRRTRGHSERVRLFCDLLSDELKLSPADAGRLRWSALIHDIGKLEIPEEILNKPASLTEEEWEVVRRHPIDGARLARPLENWLGPWFAGIAHHHERWDGSGYPMGLSAERISEAGRAIAVVDAFETMTAARAYKSPRSTMSARTELALCAGSHFDPAMVRAFLTISLPRLLWSVGPLAFLVNVPYLKWAVEGGMRTADVAAAATAATTNAAGVTVVAVAVGAMPSTAASALPNLPAAGIAEVVQSGSSGGGTRGQAAGVDAREAGEPTSLGTLRLAEGDAVSLPLTGGPFATLELPALLHADPPGLENRPDDPGAQGRDSREGHQKDHVPDTSSKSGEGYDNGHGPSHSSDKGTPAHAATGKGQESQGTAAHPATGKDQESQGKPAPAGTSGQGSSGSSSDSSGKGSGNGSSSSGSGSSGASSAQGSSATSGRSADRGSSSGSGSSGSGSSGSGHTDDHHNNDD